jgi:hypothetical protein
MHILYATTSCGSVGGSVKMTSLMRWCVQHLKLNYIELVSCYVFVRLCMYIKRHQLLFDIILSEIKYNLDV